MSGTALAEAFVALKVDDTGLVSELETATTNALDRAGPGIEKQGTGLGKRLGEGMADGLKGAAPDLDGATRKFAGGLDTVGEGADGAESRIMGLRDSVDGLTAIMQGPGEQGISAYLQGWADLASGVANFVVPALGALVPQFLKNAAATAWSTTTQLAAGAAAKVMAAGQWLLNAALTANPIGLIVVGVAALIAVFVLAWKNSETFRRVVTAAWEGIKSAAMTVVGWFQTYVWPTLQKVIGFVIGYYKLLFTVWSNVVKWIIEKGAAVITWFRELPGKIGEFFKGLADTVAAPFKSAFNLIANLWNNTVGSLSFTVPEWVPGLGGKGWDVPDMPTFGRGGYVPATPGGRIVRVAEAGEGEWIGTEAQMRAKFGGSRAGGVSVFVDARGAAPGEGAAFERAATRIAERVVEGMLREVAIG